MPAREYYLPQRRLVSQEDAAIIQQPNVPRSKFVGSWNRLTAFNAGQLIPFLVEEVLPGDHMSYNIMAYVRMATPLFPLFSNQRVDTHFFFVPNRLVWTNWVKFMGEQASPADSIAYTVPIATCPVAGYDVASLQDHMGLPTVGQIAAGQQYSHNNLPLRAYNIIFNQWFRDENLVLPAANVTGDGPDTYTDFVIRYRAKSHDYFTTLLPWPQKFTAPTVPLGGNAPISGIGIQAGAAMTAIPANYMDAAGGAVTSYPAFYDVPALAATEMAVRANAVTSIPDVYADLSQATGVTINVFRQAFLVQQLLERDARGGTRYVELIRSHFGVTNPDFRLQRPEYIGGGQTPLNITPIAQTAPSIGATVGALGAAGTAVGNHRAGYAATEHGFIIGLISIKSELAYQQGLHRMYSRSTRYDYYWPSLAGLGEQAVLRQEIYCTGTDASDVTVLGYQERWHEYRTRFSEITGIMRSTATGTLDAWHLAQRFTAAPTLNEDFIADVPPMARVLAAGSAANNQQYLADIHVARTAVRPIPTFGTPVTLGRF